MLDLLKLQVTLPDDGILEVQLSAVETRRVINSEKITKVGAGFIYQDKNCRDYWAFSGGINGDVEVTYFEMGNVSNQALIYDGPIKLLIVV